MEQIFKFCYHNGYVLSAGIIFTYFAVSPFLRSRMSQIRLLGLIAMLWPLGKVLQYTHFGSTLIRSYISDIGFATAIGLFIAYRFLGEIKSYSSNRYEFKVNLKLSLIYGISIGFFLAVLVEGAQMVMDYFNYQRLGHLSQGARGDINDMVVYLLSAMVSMVIVQHIDAYPRLRQV